MWRIILKMNELSIRYFFIVILVLPFEWFDYPNVTTIKTTLV